MNINPETKANAIKAIRESEDNETKRLKGAILFYHYIQYESLEGMDKDNMMTALCPRNEEDEDEDYLHVIACVTAGVCGFMLDQDGFDRSLPPSEQDIFFELIHPAAEQFRERFQLPDEAVPYIRAIIASTFVLVYELKTVDEVLDLMEREDFTISSINSDETYSIIRSYGFKLSDIGKFFAKVEDVMGDKDSDDYLQNMDKAQKNLNHIRDLMPVALPLLQLKLDEATYEEVVQFVRDHSEDAGNLFVMGVVTYGMIPSFAKVEELFGDTDKAEALLNALGGEAIKAAITPQTRLAAIHIFSLGLITQHGLSQMGSPVLGLDQGGVYKIFDKDE